jgi:hypothetical protein
MSDEEYMSDQKYMSDLEYMSHPSAKRKSVQKQHPILPDTPDNLSSASMYF